jgi:ubiquinone/menaquinone biosynthesis C-methylase UbiE
METLSGLSTDRDGAPLLSPPDFLQVTELAGDEVTAEQIQRLAHRYSWAGEFCKGRDVLEVACGHGQGLGYLATIANTLAAGDISAALVARANAHYKSRINVEEMDAQSLPFPDKSLDVVILFEALYYLPSPDRFMRECARVLRPNGNVLIVSANKDLYDFNPSPFSHRYYGVMELDQLCTAHNFSSQFFGVTAVNAVSLWQKLLRPIKLFAVKLRLMPKTMKGKKLLKRIVFGKLIPMPAEIDVRSVPYTPAAVLRKDVPDRRYKVLYVAATLQRNQ